MKKNPLLRNVALLLLLLPALCAAAPSTPQEQAEFLAGIDLPAGSVLAELQKSPSYKSHQKELQEKWAFCKKARYNSMQAWADANLRKDRSTRDVVRYLFGGPDFLNAYAFFPDANVMVLGGLEPVGEVPPPESLQPGSFGNSLAALREALRTSLYCGYFITSEMGGQLHRGSFHGVLPVLYTELALTGNKIQSVEMVKPFGAPGVKITYQKPGHFSSQTLYYFQSNLANGAQCQSFLSWLGGLGNGPAYLKAASYLLHNGEFSQARDFLLNTSTLIVEDDSGIPFRYFDKGGWKVQVFGEYDSPLPIFSGYAQRDFKAAYSTSANSGPIAFGAGYHVVPSRANVLLATRTGPLVASKPAPTPAATPISKAKPVVTAPAVAIAAPSATPKTAAQPAAVAVSNATSKSLVQLENDELQIRADQSLGREEKMRRLHDVWNLQLIAMGKTPNSPATVLPVRDAKPTQPSPRKSAPTKAKSLSEALESPTPRITPSPTPEPTAVPVATPAATPESASTPVTAPTPVEEKTATPAPAPAASPEAASSGSTQQPTPEPQATVQAPQTQEAAPSPSPEVPKSAPQSSATPESAPAPEKAPDSTNG